MALAAMVALAREHSQSLTDWQHRPFLKERARSYFALPGMCDLLDTITMYMGNPLPEYNSPQIWSRNYTNRHGLRSRLFSIRQVIIPGELAPGIYIVHDGREAPITLTVQRRRSFWRNQPVVVTSAYKYGRNTTRICGYTLFEAHEWNVDRLWIINQFYNTSHDVSRGHASSEGYHDDFHAISENKKWIHSGGKIHSNSANTPMHVEVPWPTHWPPGAKTVRKYPYFDGEYWCYMTEYGLWIQDRDGTWCYL